MNLAVALKRGMADVPVTTVSSAFDRSIVVLYIPYTQSIIELSHPTCNLTYVQFSYKNITI